MTWLRLARFSTGSLHDRLGSGPERATRKSIFSSTRRSLAERGQRASEALIIFHPRGGAWPSERSERAKRLSKFIPEEEPCRASAASERNADQFSFPMRSLAERAQRATETLVNFLFRGGAWPSERSERAKRRSVSMSEEELCRASETQANFHFRGGALPSERSERAKR